ncbi:MAG: hypothetical protein H0X02_11210, partial [Nitrosomonas sp.]|nr:hypothetical protein [Nitrosomonas sp.]
MRKSSRMTTVIRIGWAPGEDDECFSLVEATDPFSVGVIEFTLNGNQDYVNGFVSQLIGN